MLAVFDVDGVVADVRHRLHHLGRHRWDRFFAAADRDQELPGLDDLEVVVAHAVARTRLEPSVIAQGRVAKDGGVAVVGIGGTAPAQAEA